MKKRVISFLLAIVMVMGMAPLVHLEAHADDYAPSGTCGENLTWTFKDGTLIISGTGGMYSYRAVDSKKAPWYDLRAVIYDITIEDGVTSIGSFAFEDMKITNITLPDSVTSIGEKAFADCGDLSSISMPAGLTTVGRNAFYFCRNLESVYISDLVAWCSINFYDGGANPLYWGTPGAQLYVQDQLVTELVIPDGVTSVGTYAFSGTDFEEITIPNSITSIAAGAFAYCDKLKTVHYNGTETQWEQLKMKIAAPNDELLNATLYIDSKTGPSEPDKPEPGPVEPSDGEVKESIEQIASGTCGNNLTWVLDVRGRLTISGKGNMDNYATYPSAPWYDYRDRIFSVVIEDGVTSIGNSAFDGCNISNIEIAQSVNRIGHWAFRGCSNLTRISIPEGVTAIENSTFYSCINLKTITLPGSLTTVESAAFQYAHGLKDVYFGGSAEQWEKLYISRDMDIYDTKPYNQPLLSATVHFDVPSDARYAQMQVYTDMSNLAVDVGNVITFGVAILSKDGETLDTTGITFQLSDSYAVNVLDSGIDQETNHFYVKLQGAIEGTGYVTFSDSTTGNVVSLPLTVIENKHDAYTLHTVPVVTVFNGIRNEGPLNFYNQNGLYVDSFQATVDDSGKAKVSFDVYNTNHTYAIVEVYDENGDLYNAVLIEKMDYLNDGIKSVMWDGTGCVVRDVFLGNALTYKQETNFSKRTPVEIEVPKNGYIQITADSMESAILAVVNSADMLMATLSLLDKAEGYVDGDFEIPKRLTEQLSNDNNFKDAIKGGKDFCKGLLKGIGKDATITSKTVGDFSDTLINNLKELNLLKLVLDNAKSAGVGIAEDTIMEMMGVFGDAMELVFTIGSAGDLACQYDAYLRTVSGGVITIQNQGGGKRHCDNVVLESKVDFDPEVALQTYTVTLDESLLEKVKSKDAYTYEMLIKYVTRTYNISLLKNGEETQHSGDVAVYISIPYDLEYLDLKGNIKVFRMEEDGSVTDMDAVVEGNNIMFTTDHFSLYTLVFEGVAETPDDPDKNDQDPKPNNKDDDDDTQDSSGGGVVVRVIAVVVVVLAGSLAVLFVLKKKKK